CARNDNAITDARASEARAEAGDVVGNDVNPQTGARPARADCMSTRWSPVRIGSGNASAGGSGEPTSPSTRSAHTDSKFQARIASSTASPRYEWAPEGPAPSETCSIPPMARFEMRREGTDERGCPRRTRWAGSVIPAWAKGEGSKVDG